jgi:hypothetical protein
MGHLDTVKYLHQSGADMTIKDKVMFIYSQRHIISLIFIILYQYGRTSLDSARLSRRTEVVAYLEAAQVRFFLILLSDDAYLSHIHFYIFSTYHKIYFIITFLSELSVGVIFFCKSTLVTLSVLLLRILYYFVDGVMQLVSCSYFTF